VSAGEKREIMALVAGSGLPRRRALAQLGLPKSTYYRWLKRQAGGRLEDSKGGSPIPWNKLRAEEEEKILAQARASPELSARQIAPSVTDSDYMYVRAQYSAY
jgi:putative transposase